MIPEQFRRIPYREGGREFSGADCYGVVRLWLQHRNVVDLPPFGLVISKRRSACRDAYLQAASGFFEVVEPMPDDVICCFNKQGQLDHIGVIVDTTTGLGVYHSQASQRRPVVTPLNAFRRLFKHTELLRYGDPESLHAQSQQRGRSAAC